jgi:bifunctional UDP-N-acetylglucosamine pyrophosphorylase/glucosamine-1-phosphate N-acetyltransferase
VKIGSFGEVNRSRLGRGTRSAHFSYIGDAEIGANVNIGAGTVTCNYDGVDKHKTRIEDGAFIGSGSMLVPPLTIGAGARTGAGAVVTKDVPPDALAVGVPARVRDREDG